MTKPNRGRATSALAVGAIVLAGCGGAPSEAAGTTSEAADTTLVLAESQDLGSYNPVDGYGELGVSLLFDGLLRPESTSDSQLPDLVPALAASDPIPNADSTVWEVELREGVTFSDGSDFDADDVVATYEAVLDPQSASGIAAAYEVIESVTALDPHRVQFTLAHSYAPFPALLLLGIAPSEALVPGPAVDSALNREPIGTGPYVLSDFGPEEATFEARQDYWRGASEISRVVITHAPDDNARAQRMRAGGVDGTTLPPRLAATFDDTDDFGMHAVQSVDWRGVSLPADHPFTGDVQVRRALNIGTDRQGIIDHVLAGHGRPAHTPVGEVYGDGFNPEATFEYDVEAAGELLDAAGWKVGSDGVRAKDGERAEITIMYPASDSLRRDIGTAFSAELKKLGIDSSITGASWDDLGEHLSDAAIVLGGGDRPYDLDTQMYQVLHSRGPDTSPFDNPAGHEIPGADEALEEARRTLDPDIRNANYRDVQEAYIDHPSYVLIAFLDHTYVTANDNWEHGPLVMEPHSHGVSWGPWWNLPEWRR